jgi:hypothetical protein
MKSVILVFLTLLLVSAQPAGAGEVEPFFRITPQGGYANFVIKPAYGPAAGVQADWGGRWRVGLELTYAYLYDYEHAYDDIEPGEPGYGEPDIWDTFGAEVVGVFIFGNPAGLGGHVELGAGLGPFFGINAHLGLGLDLALGELIGLSAEVRAGLFYYAVTLGVTFFLHPA